MSYPTFPQLSRQPVLEMPENTHDPTLRDSYDNGMVSTQVRFTRALRTFDVTIELLSPADKRELDRFMRSKPGFGAKIFFFPDSSDPKHPEMLRVRFSKLPSYPRAKWGKDVIRKTVTFQIEEV